MGLRILWVAPPPYATTGYGQQTALMAKALQTLPEVEYLAVGSTAGLHQGSITYDSVDIVPCPETIFGETDVILRHMQTLRCNICITLYDVWTLKDTFGTNFVWCPIAPIDSSPLARENRRRLANAYHLIAMSQWGKGVMEEAKLSPITYIPHVVDTAIFHELPDKAALKRKLGFPEDCFLIGMVARTTKTMPVNRKGFPEGMQAIAKLAKEHDDVHLYVHAPPYMGTDSADLPGLADMFGLSWDRIRALDGYSEMMGITNEMMCEVYNAFDVYFSPSAGEGFNVPLIEAQACGLPVVANRCTAQTENVGAGWLVDPIAKITTPVNSQWFLADAMGYEMACEACGHVTHKTGLVDALADAYEQLKDKKRRKELEREARKFATKYDVRTVTALHWKPFLAQLSAELGIKPGSPEVILPEQLQPV